MYTDFFLSYLVIINNTPVTYSNMGKWNNFCLFLKLETVFESVSGCKLLKKKAIT